MCQEPSSFIVVNNQPGANRMFSVLEFYVGTVHIPISELKSCEVVFQSNSLKLGTIRY